MSAQFGGNKPVKIRSYNSSNKYGLAVKNVEELLDKGCKLLKVPRSAARLCLYSDGTEVTEEFFQTLPDNTELVLLSREQHWSGGVFEDLSRLLSTDVHSDALIEAAKQLRSDEPTSKRRKILSDLLQNLDDRSELETRDEDEDWFEGVAPRFKTKSAYMRVNCESRIRGYTRELQEASRSIKEAKVKAEFLKASEALVEMLKKAKYNGCYFDRTDEDLCLCTEEGWFTCQGAFDQDTCSSFHSINPYSSREDRIIFSTWNLDHRIEKRRTIIPTLLSALENHRISKVNLDYFYRLLFTTENLKLVHIVCHKKEAHNLPCDSWRVFRPAANTRNVGKKKKPLL
ncbi:DNA fragmentation factor subunit beta [Takifugu flavidus]|uniref:DNA fragmentation factor subunit beta n=1 Tax=Takifugu flavidus TaxID=433684 RepID=A0A5C6MM34_9TELE|nr:DNA fragmentation factor subunit beta [Takifugu flavidus]TWW56242.1 hypothetical protein D4764_08G0002290 [Takifugu flavidus]